MKNVLFGKIKDTKRFRERLSYQVKKCCVFVTQLGESFPSRWNYDVCLMWVCVEFSLGLISSGEALRPSSSSRSRPARLSGGIQLPRRSWSGSWHRSSAWAARRHGRSCRCRAAPWWHPHRWYHHPRRRSSGSWPSRRRTASPGSSWRPHLKK